MRVGFVFGVLLLATCKRADPPTMPTKVDRGPARMSGAAGHLERALDRIERANKAEPGARMETCALEVDWLAKLGRCAAARTLADMIDGSSDALAKAAASDARKECERREHVPSAAELQSMRAKFREAVRVEATNPTAARALYNDAWNIVPTLAAMLGIARAARSLGDVVMATASLDRALAFAELKSRATARIATNDHVLKKRAVHSHYADDSFLWHGTSDSIEDGYGPIVLRQDLGTGEVVPVAGFAEKGTVFAIAKDRVYIAEVPSPSGRIAEIGIDDDVTAIPVVNGAMQEAVFSRRGAWLAMPGASGGVVVVDGHTGDPIFIKEASNVLGFSDDERTLVVTDDSGLRFAHPPSWKLDARILPNGDTPGDVSGHHVAYEDLANVIHVYDLDARAEVRTIADKLDHMGRLVLAPDASTLVTSSTDQFLWNLNSSAKKQIEHILYDITFTRDSTRYIATLGNTFRERRVNDLEVLAHDDLADGPRQAVFGPSKRVLYIASDQGIARLDLDAANVETMRTPEAVVEILPAPDGAHLAVKTLSSDLVSVLYVLDAHGSISAKVEESFTPIRFDGNVLHARSATEELELDIVSGTRTKHPSSAPSASSAASISHDGKLVAHPIDLGRVRLEDKSGLALAEIEVGRDFAIVVGPSGATQIVGNDANIRCAVGPYWLPLDACRDRYLTTDPLSKTLPP